MRNPKTKIFNAVRKRKHIDRDRMTRRLISRGLVTRGSHYKPNRRGWYQMRRRAQQRLNVLSNNNLRIVENGYRGHQNKHWVIDNRCGHNYRVSLKDIFEIGADTICPFCNTTSDLRHFGRLEAVQEHIHKLTNGNLHFRSDNSLRSIDDNYNIDCNLHGYQFSTTFRKLLTKIHSHIEGCQCGLT